MANKGTSVLRWIDEPLAAGWSTRAQAWEKLVTDYGLPEVVSARFVGIVVETLVIGREDLRLVTGLRGDEPIYMAICARTDLATYALFQPSQMPIALVVAKDSTQLRTYSRDFLNSKTYPVFRFEILQADAMCYEKLGSSAAEIETDYISVPYLDFPERFDDYFALLSKNFRANFKKQHNKLDALGMAVRISVVTEASEIDTALKLYSNLEMSGWKLGKGTAVNEQTGQFNFYSALLKSYAKIGQAHIAQFWISENGIERLVASDLCIVSDGVAYMLKTAYDETLREHPELSSLSPAALMHKQLFELWIRDYRVTRLEFYGKTLDWHLRWTQQQRPLYHLSVFRNAAALSVFSHVKKIVRRVQAS